MQQLQQQWQDLCKNKLEEQKPPSDESDTPEEPDTPEDPEMIVMKKKTAKVDINIVLAPVQKENRK